MKQADEPSKLAKEIQSRITNLEVANTAAVRHMRRDFSRRLSSATRDSVLELAKLLLARKNDTLRFVSYELVSHHKTTMATLNEEELVNLGRGLHSWSSVDCFSTYLSGPLWREGRLKDETILAWAQSNGAPSDLWWRRAALVSTVALSRRGAPKDLARTLAICRLLAADREDMVVKALSWALRELAKKHPAAARDSIAQHRQILSARVVREVTSKLNTGLKSGRKRINPAV